MRAPGPTRNLTQPAVGPRQTPAPVPATQSVQQDNDGLHMDTRPENAPGSAEYVLCEGTCMVKGPSSPLVRTAFMLKVELETNSAILVLKIPGGPPRVHKIMHLTEPALEGEYCSIASVPGKGNVAYLLKLQTFDLTNKFKLYLNNLQEAAKRQSAALDSEVLEGATLANVDAVVANADEPEGCVATLTAHEASPKGLAAQVSCNITAPTDIQGGTCGGAYQATQTDKLVDFDDDDTAGCGGSATMSIEGAAERLLSFVHALEADAIGQGIPLTDTRLDELEDAAIDLWLQKGFLKDEGDDMQSDVTNLLRSLYHIKRQAFQIRRRLQSRQRDSARDMSPSLESLRDLHFPGFPARIRYKPDEILELAHRAAPPAGLDFAGLLASPDKEQIKRDPKSPSAEVEEAAQGRPAPLCHAETRESVLDLMDLGEWRQVCTHGGSSKG